MSNDNLYYWEHPAKYIRLRADDLRNDPTVKVLEIIAADIMREKRQIISVLKSNPNNEDYIGHAKRLKEDLETEFFEIISFGYRDEILKDFIENCPKGVFENRSSSSKKYESLPYRARPYIKAYESNRKGKLASSWNGGERSGNTPEHSETHYRRISPNGRRMHIPHAPDPQNR